MRERIGTGGAIGEVGDRRAAFTTIRCAGNEIAPAFCLHPAGGSPVPGEWLSIEGPPDFLAAAYRA
jgi:hypothetical protein